MPSISVGVSGKNHHVLQHFRAFQEKKNLTWIKNQQSIPLDKATFTVRAAYCVVNKNGSETTWKNRVRKTRGIDMERH